MKLSHFLPLLPFGLLISCADRPILLTSSQFAVHATGLKSEVPEKVTVGFDRSEFGWFPHGEHTSVLGNYDTEYRYPGAIAISELLVTGNAAACDDRLGSPTDDTPVLDQSPLIVSTNTRTNLGAELGGSDGSAFSFNFGFKRAVLALFPRQPPTSSEELPSTYSDIAVHTGLGAARSIAEPRSIGKERRLTTPSGARITQTIATGSAAEKLAASRKDYIANTVRNPLGFQPNP